MKFTPVYNTNTNPPGLVNCLDELGNAVDISNCIQENKDECVTCWNETNQFQCYHKDLSYVSGTARASIPSGAQSDDLIISMEIYDPTGPTLVETVPIGLTVEQWTEENLQIVLDNHFGKDRAVVSNAQSVLYLGFDIQWEEGLFNDAALVGLGGWAVTFTSDNLPYNNVFESLTTSIQESVRHFKGVLWTRCGDDGEPVDLQWRDAYSGNLLSAEEQQTLTVDCKLSDIGIDPEELEISVVKNPICFFHEGIYYEGWEIESINTQTLETLNIFATDIHRTIQVVDYQITECACNNDVPNQPLAVDDAMGESIYGLPILVPALSNDVPCALGQTTTWELISGSENNVVVINNNDGTFLANPVSPGVWDFEYRIFCDGTPTLETAIVTGNTVVFVQAVNDPQGDVQAGAPLQVDTTLNDLLCPNGSITTWTIVGGSENNVTGLINNNDGTFDFVPGLGAWDFQYEIICDGVPTGEIATVSGVGVYVVDAVNDLIPPVEAGTGAFPYDVSSNDTTCPAPAVTTFELIAGSEVNVIVSPAISSDGVFTIDPQTTDGIYSFDYEIICDGTPTGEIATVTGSVTEVFTIISTSGLNGTITPLGSVDYASGTSALYQMIPDICPILPPCTPVTVGYGFKENESKYVVFDPAAGGEGTVIDIYDNGGLFNTLDGRSIAYRSSTQQLYVSEGGQDVYAIDVTNTTPSAANPNLTYLGAISPTLNKRADGSVFYNDVWYVISEAPNIFYAIDPDTLNVISSVPLSGITDARALAVDPATGTFYVSDRDQVDFYVLDPVTGATTFCFSSNLAIKGESFSIDSQGQFGYLEESGGGNRIIYRFDLPAACGGADVVLSVVNTYENYADNIKGLDFSNDGCPPPCYNYEVCQVFVDGIQVANTENYIFSNIQADHTIHVEFCPIVEAVDDIVPDVIQSGNPEVVEVDGNDSVCPTGTEFVLVPGSEVNVVVGPPTTSSDGNFNYVVQNTGAWSFDYEIYCNGIPTGETATVSGTSQAAIANDDPIDPSYVGVQELVDVRPNDVECLPPAVTTYALIPGSEMNATVLDLGDGTFNVTPASEGAWSFDYNIFCDGVLADSATVYGNSISVNLICATQNIGGTVTPEDCIVVPEGEMQTYQIFPDYCLIDDGSGGLLYGHFDADYNVGDIYPIGAGNTDQHDHEYDDDNDTSFVDYMNNPAGWTNLQDLIDPNQRFKIVISNADINKAGFIVINNNFNINDPSTYELVMDYDDTAVSSLPIYSINGVPGSTQLTSLQMGYFPDAIARGPGGILPTNTGDVRNNNAGLYGEWRNGALTMELVAVDQFGNDLFTLNPALSNGGVQGPAVSGTMLYEATLFWHWDGPCNNGNSPSYSDPGWQEAYDEIFTSNCTGTSCDSHEICDVIVDGVSIGPVTSFTFYNVNDDHTIEAVFAPIGSCP